MYRFYIFFTYSQFFIYCLLFHCHFIIGLNSSLSFTYGLCITYYFLSVLVLLVRTNWYVVISWTSFTFSKRNDDIDMDDFDEHLHLADKDHNLPMHVSQVSHTIVSNFSYMWLSIMLCQLTKFIVCMLKSPQHEDKHKWSNNG